MTVFSMDWLIKETYLDVFGHVNNAKYLEIFEDVRWELINRGGFDLGFIKKSQTGPVILECKIQFRKELTARDRVKVTVESISYEGVIGRLRQQIIKADGNIACEAEFTYGLFDLKSRKLIPPTPEWRRALGMKDESPV